MSRSHRKKDAFAVVLILGTAIVYWTSRGGADIVLDDRPVEIDHSADGRSGRTTQLPGLGRDAD